MNSTTNYDILTSIDNMSDMIQESNTNVLESMLNASDKAFMIMENYYGNDYTNFAIFQESDEAHPFKEDGVLKTILMFIPNLFKWIANKISGLFNKQEKNAGFFKSVANKIKGTPETNAVLGWLLEHTPEWMHNPEGTMFNAPVTIGGVTVSAGLMTAAVKKFGGTFKKTQDKIINSFNHIFKDVTDIDKSKVFTFIKQVDGENSGKWSTTIDHDKITASFNDNKKILDELKNLISSIGENTPSDENIKKANEILNSYKSLKTVKPFLSSPTELTMDQITKFNDEITNLVKQYQDDIKVCTEASTKFTNSAKPAEGADDAAKNNAKKFKELGSILQKIIGPLEKDIEGTVNYSESLKSAIEEYIGDFSELQQSEIPETNGETQEFKEVEPIDVTKEYKGSEVPDAVKRIIFEKNNETGKPQLKVSEFEYDGKKYKVASEERDVTDAEGNTTKEKILKFTEEGPADNSTAEGADNAANNTGTEGTEGADNTANNTGTESADNAATDNTDDTSKNDNVTESYVDDTASRIRSHWYN